MAKVNNNVTAADILPLRQQEIDLLYILRHRYRYGTVEILVRDGLPVDILRTIERVRLDGISPSVIDGQG